MKTISLLLISMAVFSGGILSYCIMNNIIIFRGFSAPYHERHIIQSFQEHKKKITLFFMKNNTLKQESETIIMTEDNQENCMVIVNRWLSVLADESIIPFRMKVQSASFDVTEKKLVLSFEQSFLKNSDPIFKKLMLIEALLKTIRENIPFVQEVYLLVNHQPLQDAHIDTSRTWPIQGFNPL